MKKNILFSVLLSLSTMISYAGCGPLRTTFMSPSNGSVNNQITTEIKFMLSMELGGPIELHAAGYLTIFNINGQIHDYINITDVYPIGTVFTQNDTISFELNIPLQPLNTYKVVLDNNTFYSLACTSNGGYYEGWYTSNWTLFEWTFSTQNTLNVNEVENDISIYPNPFNNNLTIINDNSINDIFIYNNNGQLVFQKDFINNYEVIDLNYLNKGIYHLVIDYIDRRRVFIKIIKE